MPKATPGAVVTSIPKFLLDQAMSGIGRAFGRAPAEAAAPPLMQQVPSPGEVNILRASRVEPKLEWFGPDRPLPGQAPRGAVAGRTTDYPVGYNLAMRPRQYEPISFEMLRGLFEGFDLAKLCVNTRKNQMAKLSWEIVPRMKTGQKVRATDDPRSDQLEAFFRSPDRIHDWNTWLRTLLHDLMVFDAPTLYVRRTLGGDVYSIEVLDGTKIMPRIDQLGRTPAPPEAAYSQVLHGVPAINYTTDELIYWPQNLRPGKAYGWGTIEQILMTLQIGIRRDIAKLQYWTEGNIPEALIGTPPDWTPDQIAGFEKMFNNWTTDQANRARAKFVPAGVTVSLTRPSQTLDPQQDEWIARVITYAFNLPNLPLVAQQNRATSETADDAALREGLGPMIVWLKGLMDYIVSKIFGYPDLEFIMDDYKEEDPDAVSARELQEVKAGAMSIDEYRAKRGQAPLGMPACVFGIGPLGLMPVADIVRGIKQGVFAPAPPAPPDAGMPGATAAPYDPSQPQPGDPPPALSGPAAQPAIQMLADQRAKLKALPAPANDAAHLPPPRRRLVHETNTPTGQYVNSEIARISPEMLAAVGLTPDYGKHARPAGKRKHTVVPEHVLSTLAAHESRYKTSK
jgi:hypothetical protein